MAILTLSFGNVDLMIIATANGPRSSGRTFNAMFLNDSMNVIVELSLIMASKMGAEIATIKLLRREKVATRSIFPPSMPVITGAAVAVGQNMQIKMLWAMAILMERSAKYTAIEPNN